MRDGEGEKYRYICPLLSKPIKQLIYFLYYFLSAIVTRINQFNVEIQ